MENIEELEKKSQLSFDDVDVSTLVNIRDVQIDTTLPAPERLQQFIDQVHNPYMFLSGDTPVLIRFRDNGKTLSESLKSYLRKLAEL